MSMRHPALIVIMTTACAGSALGWQEVTWRNSALALVPAGYVGGEDYRSDQPASVGYLAVYPAGSDDPKTPGSVFAPRVMLELRLAPAGSDLQVASAELKPRVHPTRGTPWVSTDATEAEYAQRHEALAAKRAALPPGTEPCDLGAWSIDKDPKGLNVRAEPNTASRVLGILPPPYRLKMGGHENTPRGGWLTEFKIIGYRDGWFLIEGVTPPGKDYEDEKHYPRNAPKPYAGRGWVASNKAGANFANGGTRMGGLFQAPHADAKWTPVKDPQYGNEISADGGPQRLFACSGRWGLVEAYKVRGWWRSLCSNQVTNCS